jgi:hypothetical protein
MRLEEFNFLIENKVFDRSFIVNQELLKSKSMEEAIRIFPGRKNRDRTIEAVYQDVLKGKTLEFFFLEFSEGLFRLSKNIYSDLLIPTMNNKIVEVKAYSDPEGWWDKLVRDLREKNDRDPETFNYSIFYLFELKDGKYKFFRRTDLK